MVSLCKKVFHLIFFLEILVSVTMTIIGHVLPFFLKNIFNRLSENHLMTDFVTYKIQSLYYSYRVVINFVIKPVTVQYFNCFQLSISKKN